MNIMPNWMTFDDIEGVRTRRYFIDSSGKRETNQFTYYQPFWLHFRYRHQVDDHNNRRHVTIYLDSTLSTLFWPDLNLDWNLAVSEVNVDLTLCHFQKYGVVQPSLDFRRALAIYFLENKFGVELE